MISVILGAAVAAALQAQSLPAPAALQPSVMPATLEAPANQISAKDLADQRGGAENVGAAVALQDLQATDTGNSVSAQGSISSGAISMSAAALSGFSGIGNFVFNTGHNDAIQGNVTVNVVLAP